MLAKLLFLADVWAMQAYGIRATDLCYIRYKYGPYPLIEFDQRLERLKSCGLQVVPKFTVVDGKKYRIYRLPGPLSRSVELPDKMMLIADEVITTFANEKLEDVLSHVYSLPFVKSAAFEALINLEPLRTREDLLDKALTKFRAEISKPVSAEHLSAMKEAKRDLTNENIELAETMKEKQSQAFRFKQSS